MKNKGPIIFLIIILSIIIIGLIALLWMSISGKINFLSRIQNLGTKSSDVIFDTSYELESVSNLEVISVAGNITIEESTDGKIRVVAYGQNSNDLKVDLSESKLKVDYANYKKVNFGFNFYVNNIIIYIPKNYEKEIKLDVDYGNVDAIDLKNATINIKEDCGSIKLGKIRNATIKNDCGDVEIGEILNKCEIEANCGDIKISSIAIKENSSIKLDLRRCENWRNK